MINPPKLAHRFLRWFCHPDLLKGVEGDLFELFEENVTQYGPGKARRKFTWEVIKLCRPPLFRPIFGYSRMNHFDLLHHNTLMSMRVLRKERVYTVINVLGLTFGIASFLAIQEFVYFEKRFDQFHANKDRIFRLTADYSIDQADRGFLATTPPSIAPHTANNLPEIKNFVRVYDYFSNGRGDLTLASGNQKFRESKVGFVHPRFFDVFSFPLLQGDPESCLSAVRTMVLSKATAEKYFGDDNPIGQIIAVDGSSDLYTVTGVMADFPPHSHMQFDVLISYKTLDWWHEGEAESHWTDHSFYSFLLLHDGVDIAQLESKINELYLQERGAYNRSKDFDMAFRLQALKDIHFDTHLDQELATAQPTNRTILHVIAGIGWLIMVIAWINFMNLTTARSWRRYTEMGVRQALGAHRIQLTGLLITETLLIHIVALLLALILLGFAGTYLEDILGLHLNPQRLLSMLTNPQMLWVLFVFSLAIGIYPLVLVKKLRPSQSTGLVSRIRASKSWSFRALIMFQFMISTALIIGSIVLYGQLDLMQATDKGFDRYNKLIIRGPNLTDQDSDSVFQYRHERFLEEMGNLAQVRSVSSGLQVPGEKYLHNAAFGVKGHEDRQTQTLDIMNIGLNYFKTLGVDILVGETFQNNSSTTNQVMVNASAVQSLGFESVEAILGQTLMLNFKHELQVIGVVEDYHHLSSREAIKPLVFYCEFLFVHYYLIDYTGKPDQLLEQSEKLMADIFPRDPFEYFFLDERYNRQYASDIKLSKTIWLFAGIAIVIACLGLIGLASHDTLRRVKEIGIRKTFGASVSAILVLLNRETFGLLLLANLITWPIMYQVMSGYLELFATRIDLTIGLFVMAGSIIGFIGVASVSMITLKAARANPVESLRTE